MSFNNSCSHAAICTLLERRGIELEPEDYLLQMKAHLLMESDFSTGPLLQTDEAYSLGLRNYGLSFKSRWVKDMLEFKRLASELCPCIVPLYLEGRKHGVILEGWDEKVHLLNMKRREEDSPLEYQFSEQEMEEHLVFPLPLGVLEEGSQVSLRLLELTPHHHRKYKDALEKLSKELERPEDYRNHLMLFRPLLLDLPDALTFLEQWKDVRERLLVFQRELLDYSSGKKEAPFQWRELLACFEDYLIGAEKELNQVLLTL